jgi:hypothetical protein
MSDLANVVDVDDTIVVHSPPIVLGKVPIWNTRTVTCRYDWKSKMHTYLENLFSQLFSYDCVSLAYVVEKYTRVIYGNGMPYRYCNLSQRHTNALKEVEQLFTPSGHVCQEDLLQMKIFTDTLFLLDTYADQKRIEDFEEIAFVLTIIINFPVIAKGMTRW